MCKQCVDACREVFPEVPDDEVSDFLWETTCFPAGDHKMVRKQLVQNRQRMKTDDYRECYAIAEKDVDDAMKQLPNLQGERDDPRS